MIRVPHGVLLLWLGIEVVLHAYLFVVVWKKETP
jgi:hypothetical protein